MEDSVSKKAVDYGYQLDVPLDEVPLLSKGLLYEKSHPFYKKSVVQYRAMTPREEHYLMSPALVKNNLAVDKIISSCITEGDLDVESLLIGDRDALMVSIRMSGYGRIYAASLVCPSCENKSNIEIDLAALPIKRLSLTPCQKDKNLFSFFLPKTNKTIKFSFLTVKDEKELISIYGNDEIPASRKLLKSIKEVEGVSEGKIEKFIMNISSYDSMAFRNYVYEHEPKLLMKSNFECPSCEFSDSFNLPKNYDFFGVSPADKKDVFLEPMFLLGYYFGMSYQDYLHFPLAYRKWLIDRISQEIKKSQEEGSNDIPTKGAHHNSPDVRAMTNKTRTNVPSRLQRFT